VVWDVKSGINAACRDDKFPFGKGAAGIRYLVVEVKITQNQVRPGKKRKNPLGRYGVVGRTICPKKVHRADSKGVVGGPTKPLRRKNIN